jgi:hypothetical protein
MMSLRLLAGHNAASAAVTKGVLIVEIRRAITSLISAALCPDSAVPRRCVEHQPGERQQRAGIKYKYDAAARYQGATKNPTGEGAEKLAAGENAERRATPVSCS